MFKSLQSARGLAALAVCAFHASLFFRAAGAAVPEFWLELAAVGRHGVEFFFALSGFIIMYAHHGDMNRPDRLPRYAIKRFIRIYPLYWWLTLLTLLQLNRLGETGNYAFLDVLSWISLIRFTSAPAPLLPAWTLFHEVFFYGMFALLMWRRQVGYGVAVLWLASIFLFGGTVPDGTAAFLRLALAPVNLCFFGGIAAYAMHGRLSAPRAAWCVALGMAVFALAMVFVTERRHPVLLPAMQAVAFCLVIAGLVALERHGRMLNIAWLFVVGDASYTLYLSHLILITGLMKCARELGFGPVVGWPVLFVLVLAATTGLAVLLYRYIERPMLDFCKRRWLKTPQQASTLPA